jgi:four helix bundle protein
VINSKDRSYKFALDIIKFIDSLPTSMTSQIIARQLLRSATSVGANIVEGQASSSRRDFTNFFNHSLKSANETVFWLNLLKDSKKAEGQVVDPLIKEAIEISKILGSSILTLKKTQLKVYSFSFAFLALSFALLITYF